MGILFLRTCNVRTQFDAYYKICILIHFSGLIRRAVLISKPNMDRQKKVVMSINSNREKMLPPRKSPRVPPIELRRSMMVNGSNFVT